MKLIEILAHINNKAELYFLEEHQAIMFYENEYFQELADPDFSYEYKEIENNVWIFNDKYGNTLGVRFIPSAKYFESFFIIKSKNDKEVIVFDIEKSKNNLDISSFQGGTDEHRSDTICKILLDEVLPKYLLKSKPSLIRLHPLETYRYKIFLKCAEMCCERYPQLKIKELNNEIILLNK